MADSGVEIASSLSGANSTNLTRKLPMQIQEILTIHEIVNEIKALRRKESQDQKLSQDQKELRQQQEGSLEINIKYNDYELEKYKINSM